MLITSFGKTDVGRVRKHNEDAFVSLPELGLWIVADGMGGHDGGEIASSIVCQVITSHIMQGGVLTDAIQLAHEAVIDAAERGDGALGMGSTVVALQIKGSQYEVVWVGDSRAYHLRDLLKLVTHDHSYVQQLIDAGAITEEQAQTHPQRNLITQSVGSVVNHQLQVESVVGSLNHGEKLLLCSDGLSGEVDSETLETLTKKYQDPQKLVEALVSLANQNGGRDNITAIVISHPATVGSVENSGPLHTVFQKLSPFYSFLIPALSSLTVLTLYSLLKSLSL